MPGVSAEADALLAPTPAARPSRSGFSHAYNAPREIGMPSDLGGRPPHEPTRERQNTVQVMHSNGIPLRIIAKTIGIDIKTLRKHYRDELRDARWQVEAAMGAALISSANKGAWGAAKYWLTVNGDRRWRVPEHHLIGGDPDAPPVRLDVDQMTEAEIAAELDAIRERRRIAAGARALAEALPKRSNGVGH
jgi:hypothetical protein